MGSSFLVNNKQRGHENSVYFEKKKTETHVFMTTFSAISTFDE